MNVLITNQQESVLAGLNIEIIKTLRGEYDVEEIISQFSNFFFGRMVFDVTAMKNYHDITNYQKLSIGLPVDKIILMLPNDEEFSNPSFISQLISMGFYNFGKTFDEIVYLLANPNTYKDVAYLHQLSPINNTNVAINNVDAPKQAVATAPKQVAQISKIIGLKNVTSNAGATTLAYLMKRELETIHGKSALAIEVNKREFTYFNDPSLVSVNKVDLMPQLLKARNYNVVIVDLNDCDPSVCDDVIYLIEPSILKLNKLLKLDNGIFDKLKGKKIVLNKTLVSGGNIDTFEYETGLKVFHVIKPLDDRSSKPMLTDLFVKLGVIKK